MKKNIVFISIFLILANSLIGCYFEDNSQLIITDIVSGISTVPSVEFTRVRHVEKQIPFKVEVDIVEDNTYKMTCYYNNIIIQSADNILPEFDDSVSFEYTYVNSEKLMPYYLYTPTSAAKTKQKYPLIVWLHGSGEKDVSETVFKSCGLPSVLDNWTLSGFNAYIICPQLAAGYNYGSWNNSVSQNNLQNLLDSFISENNINPDKVVIVGHSLGGQGSLYMAAAMPNYFKACISLSPYTPGINMSDVDIPVIGYSEYGLSYAEIMRQLWGNESLTYLKTTHGNLPNVVFNLDEDNNNKSDIVEWIFLQLKNK